MSSQNWQFLTPSSPLVKGIKERGWTADDVTVRPWLPVNIFLVVTMIWFSYTDKLYIKMLGISFSPQNYHHHQQFLSKLKENNENDMTFCYFSCFGWYCFRPTSMAALSSSPLAHWYMQVDGKHRGQKISQIERSLSDFCPMGTTCFEY